jgi:hypothetical protein
MIFPAWFWAKTSKVTKAATRVDPPIMLLTKMGLAGCSSQRGPPLWASRAAAAPVAGISDEHQHFPAAWVAHSTSGHNWCLPVDYPAHPCSCLFKGREYHFHLHDVVQINVPHIILMVGGYLYTSIGIRPILFFTINYVTIHDHVTLLCDKLMRNADLFPKFLIEFHLCLRVKCQRRQRPPLRIR